MAPSEITLLDRRRVLAVTWADGSTDRLAAGRLRLASRGATAVRDGIEGRSPDALDVEVADIRLVGTYAVQLVFSDGHDRGIYPWSYLRELAAGA